MVVGPRYCKGLFEGPDLGLELGLDYGQDVGLDKPRPGWAGSQGPSHPSVDQEPLPVCFQEETLELKTVGLQ